LPFFAAGAVVSAAGFDESQAANSATLAQADNTNLKII